jgi:NADH-quinone oxidoreductase subunit G
MPEIVIDGRRITAKQGSTVIQAAFENGMQIAHFCWHPELSISGNCRMCLVEIGNPKRLPDGTFEQDGQGNLTIGWFPKLQIACATVVSDNLHIRTNTDKVNLAREAVMEFLLINHPLDCPICDEAGQCKLQEYAFQHSAGESRFEETKNHKDKRQVWGPNVLYDAERCISCSRCIRFAKEVANQDVLTFVQRGDHVTIKLFDGTALDNPYSMNVIDICPVGALTSPDFRFKSRVWDMSFNDSICPGCSKGCNIQIGVRNNEILRLEPRTNMYVNNHWMCDHGRITQYKFVNENRISAPLFNNGADKKELSWEEAYIIAANELKTFKPEEVLFIGSAHATNEDNYLLKKLSDGFFKNSAMDYISWRDDAFGDDMLKSKYITPNEIGAGLILKPEKADFQTLTGLADRIKAGSFKAAFIMQENFQDDVSFIEILKSIGFLIYCSTNNDKLAQAADLVLASSTYAETEGTYTNIDGRVQHFMPAITTRENLRTMGLKMSRLDKFGAHNDRWTHHEQRISRQNWRSIMNIAHLLGADWKFMNSSDVFEEIAGVYPKFKGMSYELLDKHQGLLIGKADQPDPVLNKYESHFMKPN